MNRGDLSVGHMAMVLSVLFFGLNIPALKQLMPEWLTASDSTVFRLAGGAILFWVVSIFTKNDKIERSDWLSLVMSGVLGLFSFIFFFNLGIENSSPVDVSIIMAMPPVLVVIFSAILFKEHISGRALIGLLLSFSGALMLILIGHETTAPRTMKGNLYTTIAAVCYAFYLISIKKTSAKYTPISQLRWIFLFAALISIPIGISGVLKSKIVTDPSAMPLLTLLLIILLPTFLAYLLMPIAIKRIGERAVSSYLYFIPVITSVAAIITKMDRLHWDQPVAVAIILLGVFLSSKRE